MKNVHEYDRRACIPLHQRKMTTEEWNGIFNKLN